MNGLIFFNQNNFFEIGLNQGERKRWKLLNGHCKSAKGILKNNGRVQGICWNRGKNAHVSRSGYRFKVMQMSEMISRG